MSDTNKTERLASAVYLITGFFADQEPLKWRLRSLVSDLVVRSMVLKDNFSTDRSRISLEIRQISLEISTLFSLAKNAGLVSEMNNDLVQREFKKYSDTVTLPQGMRERERKVELMLDEAQEKGEKGEITDIFIEERTYHQDKQLREFGAVAVKKNTRRSVIIGLLKRKKEIIIRDVSSLIHGCSEKTIQRELLAMVRNGILKKEGEKRWSRYSLV